MHEYVYFLLCGGGNYACTCRIWRWNGFSGYEFKADKELDYVDYKLSHNAKYQILFYEWIRQRKKCFKKTVLIIKPIWFMSNGFLSTLYTCKPSFPQTAPGHSVALWHQGAEISFEMAQSLVHATRSCRPSLSSACDQ